MDDSLGTIIVGTAVGLLSGVLSSAMVARLFYLRTLLDRVSERLKRCCPYRRENLREGDGLEETAWSLTIDAELLRSAKFRRASKAVLEISRQMQEFPTLSSPRPDETASRDNLKRRWEDSVRALYTFRSWWWEV